MLHNPILVGDPYDLEALPTGELIVADSNAKTPTGGGAALIGVCSVGL